VTDGDELFTMQPNFGAKMVKDKTTQDKTKEEVSLVNRLGGVLTLSRPFGLEAVWGEGWLE